MAFSDVILILGSLLDEDKRVISFWNWPDFVSARETPLRSLKAIFKLHGLQDLRDQVIAHRYGTLSKHLSRRKNQGYIDPAYVAKAQEILLELIILFKLT